MPWSIRWFKVVALAAVVPFGGFAVERRLPGWAGAAMPASASDSETENAAVSS